MLYSYSPTLQGLDCKFLGAGFCPSRKTLCLLISLLPSLHVCNQNRSNQKCSGPDGEKGLWKRIGMQLTCSFLELFVLAVCEYERLGRKKEEKHIRRETLLCFGKHLHHCTNICTSFNASPVQRPVLQTEITAFSRGQDLKNSTNPSNCGLGPQRSLILGVTANSKLFCIFFFRW